MIQRTTTRKAAKSAPATRARKPGNAPTRASAARKPAAGDVLKELKTLAKELNKAAKGLGRSTGSDPTVIAATLSTVERMTADAANKSLVEAEVAKQVLATARESLGKDWSRKEIDAALHAVSGHLTNIIVAQEFQDLAGQAIRKAMKALVGAIVEETIAGDDKKLTQAEADALMKQLMG